MRERRSRAEANNRAGDSSAGGRASATGGGVSATGGGATSGGGGASGGRTNQSQGGGDGQQQVAGATGKCDYVYFYLSDAYKIKL